MPDPDLVCEVRTEGGVFRDWLTVMVSQSFDAAWYRNFRLTCAEPSRRMMQRLFPGQRVDIALAGQVVIREGYIRNRQSGYDANRHGVQIDGYSKAGLTIEASADTGTGQFRGYTLEAIAGAALKKHGLKFRLENPPPGANEPFPNVRVRHGETPYDLISRLCRQRGLWIRAEANGDIIAGARQGGGGIVFEEGVNIFSANCSIEMPKVDEIIARSQQPGSDSLFGRKAAEVSAKGTMSGGVKGLSRKVLAEMPLSQRELQLRTNMEMQAIEASLMRVSIGYRGWLNPAGRLWDLTDFATVRSPMLFPTESGQMDLKLWGYTYTQTPEGQTLTSTEFVNEKAFQQKNPSGTQTDGFFNQPSTEAQPEVAT